MSEGFQDDALIAELLPTFIAEANEQVAAFEQLMLELEDAPADHELLGALFRCAHTVKGSAGMFGLDRVVAFTHHVESLLDRLREGELALTPALSTLLLESNDEIRHLVATASSPDIEADLQARAQLVERLHAALGADGGSHAPALPGAPAAPSPAEAPRRWHLAARFGAETFRNGMDPLSILHYLAGLGQVQHLVFDRGAVPPLEALDAESCHLAYEFDLETTASRERIESAFDFVREDSTLRLDEPANTPPPTAGERPDPTLAAPPPPAEDATRGATPRQREATAASAGDDGSYIRVHAARLDEVITLLGELVIAGAGASQLARQTRQRNLIEANHQITRLIEGIRNSTLKLRMVPIGATFSRFRRVVRDTAAELGKDVVLDIVGGDTELDKAVVERIADPLMHLVRNALDHGLETPAQREAAGKPARGKLTLHACHESGNVLIRIMDDGRGIRRDKVLERAWQRGLLADGLVPADEDILKLIFEPGFSTAEKVTNLSGRGVGMDVVRSNIEALRGSVTIDSVEGQGSTIEIRLPLTLAIIDGFLVGVGHSRFIFPLDAVVEVIASRNDSLTLDAQGRGCIELRGSLLPVIDLRTLYALDAPPPATRSIVVARIGTRRFGVLVDSLQGQHQTVIKPLGRLLSSLRGISGSSILGTGEVALIFDVDSLGKLAAGPGTFTSRRSDGPAEAAFELTLEGKPS